MKIEAWAMDYSPKRLIVVFVLFYGIIAGLSSALIMVINQISLNSRGMFGFPELGMIVILSTAGVIMGFKMGDLYMFVYNIFAGLLKNHKVKVNSRI
jgi:hypothetical protein